MRGSQSNPNPSQSARDKDIISDEEPTMEDNPFALEVEEGPPDLLPESSWEVWDTPLDGKPENSMT